MWKWIIGVPVAIFAFIMIVGTSLRTPESDRRYNLISACEDRVAAQIVSDTRYKVNCENLVDRMQEAQK